MKKNIVSLLQNMSSTGFEPKCLSMQGKRHTTKPPVDDLQFWSN